MEIKSNAIREKESQDARAFSDYKYVRWCKSYSIEAYVATRRQVAASQLLCGEFLQSWR